jgi:hypothetical protein
MIPSLRESQNVPVREQNMFLTSTHSCPTTKKLEALSYPVGMTRLDLTLAHLEMWVL